MATRNILVGKIGKTVKFANNKIETGGGNDVILFSTIARMHPDWMLWIVGPNELYKIENTPAYDIMFPAHNCKSLYAIDKNEWEYTKRFKPIFDNIRKEGIEGNIDCAVFFSGMASNVNIPGLLKKQDNTEYSILNSYLSYVAPYLVVLNETSVPFYCIAEDARYITINARDLYNRERLIFTQYNGEVEAYKHIANKDDIWTQNTSKHKAVYADIEKIPLLGVPRDWRNNIDIERKVKSPVNKRFFVLSNGCGTAKINHAGNNSSRLSVYKKWVHEATNGTEYDGAKVYGSWDDNIYEENKWIEKKFIVDMADDIADCRYSLVYSQVRGFVTAKAYELICLGIIPFIHPDYDPERLLGLPEFLYVKTPEEMLSKMRRMDENPDGYRKVINICMDVIQPEWQDGSLIVNGIFSRIADDLEWQDYHDTDGVDNIFTHFAKDAFDYEGQGIKLNGKKK